MVKKNICFCYEKKIFVRHVGILLLKAQESEAAQNQMAGFVV